MRTKPEAAPDLRRALARVEPPIVARYHRLLTLLRGYGSVCIGYSGGVDSVLLAQAAVHALGRERVLARLDAAIATLAELEDAA
jgi:PP-loop superfamily ATP-utilizing enzyme